MENDNESQIIISSVILGDLLILTTIFVLISSLWEINLDWSLMHHCMVLILCYVVSITSFDSVTLHKRQVRADQIFTTVLINCIRFFSIWLAILAISDVDIRLTWGLGIFGVSTFVALVIYRLIFGLIVRQVRRLSHNRCRVIYVGSTKNIVELYDEMTISQDLGYSVVGYFDNEPNPKFPATYLGKCDAVTEYIGANNIHKVYCSLPSVMKDTILPIISYCESHMVRFYSVPNLRNYLHRRVTLEMFSNTPVLSIRPEPLAKLDSRIIKRTFDIIFSGLFLITLFPIIFIIFGTLIKLSSRGPIFFRQKRNGIDGKEFWCYKFRSMKVNVDCDTLQASEDDPRKTAVGDFMRRTNIDELPQFINVFFGSMSIVGPRPHMLKHTEEYSKLINTYMVRHLVKPGVTGWAQVTGYRGETKHLSEMEGRVSADIWYMEHWTFSLDLYIILKTVTNVLSRSDSKAF